LCHITTGFEEALMEYIHAPLDETVEFIAGSYEIESENKLQYGDEEVLYIVGNTSQVCSCCSQICGGMRFITVPGFITAWKSRTSEAGFPVTDIELVADETAREEITGMLQQEYLVSSIGFW
jgi:hypothetical protein